MKIIRSILVATCVMTNWLAAPWANAAISGTTFTTLVRFNNTNNGANPYAPPAFGADGNLYGVAAFGGTNGAGVIYRVSTNVTATPLHTFDTNTWDGKFPIGRLVSGQNGTLYGEARAGGTNGLGTIFAITTNGTFSVLYSFGRITNSLGYALDGSTPISGLVQGRDGKFYGTTFDGGSNNLGTVFQFLTNGTLAMLHSFSGNGSNTDGANPYIGPLVEGADGVFYGTTFSGGTNNDGTIYQIGADGTFATLFQFNRTNGLNPWSGLSFAPNGILYGTATFGGTNNLGTVFQITTNGVLTTLCQFGGNFGNNPYGGVVPGLNNVLYGTTYNGGANSAGTIFQLTTNGQFTTLYDFTSGADGATPLSSLIRDNSGNLYGAALYSGGSGFGTVYRWQDHTPPTNSITAPNPGQRWSNMVFTATGKPVDNVRVADVFYSLNGADFTLANTTNKWTNWIATLSLIPGTNSLRAFSRDYSGNLSATNSVNFDFVVTNQLTLSRIGLGTFKPNYSNAWLEVGRNYSITSAPASGFALTNWLVSTNGIAGGALVTGTNLHFMMSSNLSLQANFLDMAKPTLTFTAPAAGQKMTNALATVLGTAADNSQVASVWYQLNGGNWSPATSTNGYTNWTSALLTLVTGTNSVKAYAADVTGNLSVTNNLNFVSSNTFQLQMSFALAQPLTTTGLNLSLQISPHLNGHIQVSSNLTTWTALTNFVGTNTVLNFRDAEATNASHRFYRAVIP